MPPKFHFETSPFSPPSPKLLLPYELTDPYETNAAHSRRKLFPVADSCSRSPFNFHEEALNCPPRLSPSKVLNTMPESRDRLSRQEDVISSYSRRRISSPSDRPTGRGSSIIFVLEDESGEGQYAGTPFRWRHTAMAGTPGSMGVAAGRGIIGTPRIGRIEPTIGRENLSPLVGSGRGRGSGRGNILPTWYPRRPLNDITAVVRAIERRREHRRGGEGLRTEGPLLQDQIFHTPSVSTSSHAPLEHDISAASPQLTFSNRKCPPTIGKVPKILLNVTNKKDGDSACLTPQKKLLNNIDTVEKVVMEELRKLKRTPSAKKAEREKRVRTLLSMR